jgi:hypothetical protein
LILSPREPGGHRGTSNTPPEIQTYDSVSGFAAPRQLGSNAFDETVHLVAIVFGMSQY